VEPVSTTPPSRSRRPNNPNHPKETNTMTTIVAPDTKSEQSQSQEWPTLDGAPADTSREEPEADFVDPTRRRRIGADPYDDPTQGRRIGADPNDDPTQGRRIGADPTTSPPARARPLPPRKWDVHPAHSAGRPDIRQRCASIHGADRRRRDGSPRPFLRSLASNSRCLLEPG
jgi:hypothetical protein